jgi:hypothetical protein
MTQIIGKGENTVLDILKEIYGNTVIYSTQILFKDLISFELIPEGLSERQQKESVDIVLFSGFSPICIRVQGGDHGGALKSARDSVQKQMLEWSNCIVVDVWHYNCPTVFKEKLNNDSRREVKESLKTSNVDY